MRLRIQEPYIPIYIVQDILEEAGYRDGKIGIERGRRQSTWIIVGVVTNFDNCWSSYDIAAAHCLVIARYQDICHRSGQFLNIGRGGTR
jgi:hypothetical protein